jgi:hypothetical protein
MSRSKINLCQFCKQDVIRDCKPRPGEPCLISSITKLVDMGGQVGLSVQDMIDLLNGGLSLADLVKSIAGAAMVASCSDSSYVA